MSLRVAGGVMVALGIVSVIIGIVLLVRAGRSLIPKRTFPIILLVAGIILALIGGILLARSQSA